MPQGLRGEPRRLMAFRSRLKKVSGAARIAAERTVIRHIEAPRSKREAGPAATPELGGLPTLAGFKPAGTYELPRANLFNRLENGKYSPKGPGAPCQARSDADVAEARALRRSRPDRSKRCRSRMPFGYPGGISHPGSSWAAGFAI